jgi:hypothetical protein
MKQFNWLGWGLVNVVFLLLFFGGVTELHPTFSRYLVFGWVFNVAFVGMYFVRQRV